MNDTTEAVYRFIRAHMDVHEGLAPSQREIADGCFIVRSNVVRHLDLLEAWGRIVRNPNQARSIRLTKELRES